MKESTKQLRHDKALAELLGITLEEVQEQRQKEETDSKIREAQAVFLFLEKPDKFIPKICSWCKQSFLTSYEFVSLCSSACRIAALASCGIDWNPMHDPRERWMRAKIPTEYSIPPAALEILLKLAVDQENTQDEPQTPKVYEPYQAIALYMQTDEPDESPANIAQQNSDALEDSFDELLASIESGLED